MDLELNSEGGSGGSRVQVFRRYMWPLRCRGMHAISTSAIRRTMKGSPNPMSSLESALYGGVNRTSGRQDPEPCTTYAANSPDEVASRLEPTAALEDDIENDS
jgi:hypothetical protein